MPFLDEIIAGLNSNWQAKLPSYLPANMPTRFCGIAETIIELIDGNKVKKYPAIIGLDGDAIVDGSRYSMIDIDEDYPLNIYHRLEGIANSTLKTGFGDNQGDNLEVANMALIVIAFRNKTNIVAHQFEAFLKDSLPVNTKISVQNAVVQRSNFKVGNSNFDKLQLLSREYTEVEVDYPELIVFELKYRIESTWKKGCIVS